MKILPKAKSVFGPNSAEMSLPVAARVLPLLGAVCLLIVLALTFSPSTFKQPTSIGLTSPPYFAPWLKKNILDGCHHVYLDMGTNMWDLNQTNTAFMFNSEASR